MHHIVFEVHFLVLDWIIYLRPSLNFPIPLAQTTVLVQSSAQHHDLVKKVHSLNVITDSNRLLREEKERLEQQLEQLKAKAFGNTLLLVLNPPYIAERKVPNPSP